MKNLGSKSPCSRKRWKFWQKIQCMVGYNPWRYCSNNTRN